MNNDTADAMELKPCPFCGGEAQRVTLTEEDEPMNAGGDVITCLKCQASSHVEFGRKENLAECWNTRTTALPEKLDERIVHVSGAKPMSAETVHHLNAIADAACRAIPPAPLPAAQDGLVDALRKALHRLAVAAEEDMNRDEPEGVDGSEIDAANNAILNSYPQVFTDEQVAKLTGWQECELTHSLTCPNGPHGFHDDDGTPLPDDLFAHSNGLFCPHCDYRQDWAPDVCFGPLPQLPDSFRAALASIEVKSS